jgi:hypothetical protein
MADLGQIGTLIDSTSDGQYRYSISGTVTDSLGAPKQTYVVFITTGDGYSTPPSIDRIALSSLTGTYAAPFTTNSSKTVICVDVSDPHANDIVFGKVVPK